MPNRLTQAIKTSDQPAVDLFFRQAGAPAPGILWRPTVDDVAPGPLRFLLRHWNQLRGDAVAPNPDQIDPIELKEALGYIMILDAVNDGADFRYRVYGSKISSRAGFDMTGKLVSELASSPLMGAFFAAAYRAARARCEPLLTVHLPPPHVSVVRWTRLILPLFDPAGKVNRLLVGSMPGAMREADGADAVNRG